MTLSRYITALTAAAVAFNVSGANAQEPKAPTPSQLSAAVAKFCSNLANLQDEGDPVDVKNPSWAEQLEATALSIGCFLSWQDEGAEVASSLKAKIKELQTILLNYAMAHDFEILDGSIDGILGKLTTADFIEISRYVDLKDAYINYSYDPLSDTTLYLKRFGQELRRFDKEGFDATAAEFKKEPPQEPIEFCTGQPFGYSGICGSSSATLNIPAKHFT